ncbi:RluA family pseudouridine synthase [Rhodopirellula sp. MGV]|uniref:RluA family pseudouridine synthase n=1 Tax=Rhodopirellula sp. MGV TaxID=2023130 RepID=UPI0013043A47|nr:RluA family pseudouridine synthase [Rhodopirellula sp. MGV]
MNDSEIEVVWQCDCALAINKPYGVATQAPAGIDSVETQLIRQLSRHGEYLTFPHRLDRAVSGVLLVALTKRAARLLSGQFATRKTAKHYVAVVEGIVETDNQADVRWEDQLLKLPGKPQTQVVPPNTEGAKQAITDVRVLDQYPDEDRTRLALRPLTGRMHQLRVQCASRGTPIVGDQLYGASQSIQTDIGERILLHAEKLEFHNPSTGRRETAIAPCPF